MKDNKKRYNDNEKVRLNRVPPEGKKDSNKIVNKVKKFSDQIEDFLFLTEENSKIDHRNNLEKENNFIENSKNQNQIKPPNLKPHHNTPELEKPVKKSKFHSLLGKIENYEKEGKFGFDNKKTIYGIGIFCLILFVLGSSLYYFGVYQPYQSEIAEAKTGKLNELNSLYTGPLTVYPGVSDLKNAIEDSQTLGEINSIDIIRPATSAWREYHLDKINGSKDDFNRIMISYDDNSSKNELLSTSEAKNIVSSNDGHYLSNIEFKKVDTVGVPLLISRLQASGGLISTGSTVDIYLGNPNSTDTNTSTNEALIKGATILSIMRSKDSGDVNSNTLKTDSYSTDTVNSTMLSEDSYSTNVDEMLKGAISGGYDESTTSSLLKSYGLKLSDYERESNIGDLYSEYLIMVELPREDVNFVLKHSKEIIITIPTNNAPQWMNNQLYSTYNQ